MHKKKQANQIIGKNLEVLPNQNLASTDRPNDAQLIFDHNAITSKHEFNFAWTSLTELDNKNVSHGFDLIDVMNAQYIADIYLGTPPQSFLVLMDTGSSTFFVPSSRYKSFACLNHQNFDASKSETYHKNDTTFAIHYGSGDINGIISNDVLSVGDLVIRDIDIGESMEVNGYP